MMSTALLTSSGAILAALLSCVALADWLSRIGHLRKFGAAIIVILFGAVLANTGVIPPAARGGPVYDVIFSSVIAAAVFLVLLDVNLAAIRSAGAAMIGTFFLGAAGTAAGVFVAAHVMPGIAMLGPNAAPVAGMFTGTYIGGGANFNAVAIGYGISRDGTVYTAATMVDNVMTDVWILITLALPALLGRTGWFGKPKSVPAPAPAQAVAASPLPGTLGIGVPLALTAIVLVCANAAEQWLAQAHISVPSILIVTTVALLCAQLPITRRMSQANGLGIWAMYLFLAVVGANADLAALARSGPLALMLFGYVGIIFAVHALILFGIGAWLKCEPIILALASSANIGGSSTAFVLAETEGRPDLVLPAILIGSIGTAIGTYAGFAMAWALH